MRKYAVIAALGAAVLSACGGGSGNSESSPPPPPPPPSVNIKVIGGGLEASSGANHAAAVVSDYRNWPELVAQQLNGKSLCSRFSLEGAGASIAWAPKNAGCASYAINDVRRAPLTNVPASLDADDGNSIVGQLQRAAAEGWDSRDFLLVGAGYSQVLDGRATLSVLGGLGASSEPTVIANLITRLERLLGTAALNTRLPSNQRTLDAVVDLYMAAQAERLADAIDRYALQKGVARVVVLNAIPAYLLVPNDPAWLPRLDKWTRSFNTALAQRFANHEKVRIVDAHQAIKDQIAQPQQHGYANASTPACASVPNAAPCSAEALTAIPAPADSTDKSPNWWKSYMVWQWVDSSSDSSTSMHRVSQRTQDSLAALVMAEIAKAGWK
ncbi:MAG: hypothetical protein F9K35_03695 [Burkholderiaceae bacterium]|nr:MAG: hypothetical protein F9K35_03695 [Burkholderiaceae bacterium]